MQCACHAVCLPCGVPTILYDYHAVCSAFKPLAVYEALPAPLKFCSASVYILLDVFVEQRIRLCQPPPKKYSTVVDVDVDVDVFLAQYTVGSVMKQSNEIQLEW